MKMPQLLTKHADNHSGAQRFLIGETGFSFVRSHHMDAPLSPLPRVNLPKALSRVLRTEGSLGDVDGLVHANTVTNVGDSAAAEWILASSQTAGLLSIVLRTARRSEPDQLMKDIQFAVTEGKRFCAVAAILCVQQRLAGTAKAISSLKEAFEMQDIETDRLYRGNSLGNLPVWFAVLTHT